MQIQKLDKSIRIKCHISFLLAEVGGEKDDTSHFRFILLERVQENSEEFLT